MADYVYRKMVRRHWYGRFLFRRKAAVVFILILLLIGAAMWLDLHHSNKKDQPVSATTDSEVEDIVSTFNSQYYRFQDTGKWVLSKQESSPQKNIYYKYRGADLQYQLVVYVNQVPIPLYLAVSRVLPVRIVNNNSFDVTSVSGPCVGSYAPGELHKVKIANINGADMLCDPDTPQYTVVVAEVNGNYELHLQRPDGTPISFVITFRDLTSAPGADSLMRIAGSFQTL